MQDLGLEGRTDCPEGWGRREPHCARGAGRRARRTGAGEPRGRRPGGLGVALKFCAGGSGSEKANVGRVLRGVQGRPGVSNSREKQMEGETCAPAGGRGAGRRVRAGTRGGAGKPRRPRGCGDRVTGGRRPSPTRPSQGSGLGHEGARAGGLGGRSLRALPRASTLTFQVRLRLSSLGGSGTSAPRGSPLRHPKKLKKCRGQAAARPSLPHPPPPPKRLSHHPWRRRWPTCSSTRCPWCRLRGRRRHGLSPGAPSTAQRPPPPPAQPPADRKSVV